MTKFVMSLRIYQVIVSYSTPSLARIVLLGTLTFPHERHERELILATKMDLSRWKSHHISQRLQIGPSPLNHLWEDR